MRNSVKVTADAAGNVISRSKNPEYGTIRVEQQRTFIDANGFARTKKLSALIPGTVDDLAGFQWEANQEVEGKIIVKESLEAFNKKNPAIDYKIAGTSGIICSHDGHPIYRKHFYVMDDTAKDELINHTNKEEIQAAYAEEKEQEEEIIVNQGDDLSID